ncbi:MAG: enolase C-terminal domain-like protein [Kiritimatiellia bacterium]
MVPKPTALGGFARAREIGAAAAAAGAKSVVSSLFESSIGLAHLAHFAASLDNASTHHGLDTAGAFSSDTLTAPLRVEDGRLSAPPLDGLVRLMNESPLRGPACLRFAVCFRSPPRPPPTSPVSSRPAGARATPCWKTA